MIAYKSSLDQLDINGGTAVTTDSEGAIYIAGISIMGGDNVVKFERDLNCPPTLDYCYLEVDWTTHFGTTVMWEQPNSIELDIDGNIYVSGSSRLTDTSFYDCLVTKYDPSGNKLWESRYDADGYEDLHIDMEMDDYANVYLACRSVVGGPLQRDYVAIKYDSNGSEVWAKRYDGPVNGADYITDIELDGDDDVYVTGQASSIEGLDFATVKYIEATTENAIASLLLAIESMEFSHGIDNSLKTKIKKLPKMVSSGNRKAASNVTQAFIHQVEGIQGTKLTNKQANELITHVQELLLTME